MNTVSKNRPLSLALKEAMRINTMKEEIQLLAFRQRLNTIIQRGKTVSLSFSWNSPPKRTNVNFTNQC